MIDAGYDKVMEGICNLLAHWDEVESADDVMAEFLGYIYAKRQDNMSSEYPIIPSHWG